MTRTKISNPRWLQVKVERSLWLGLASEALRLDKSVSDLVRGVLVREFGGPVRVAEAAPRTGVHAVRTGGSTPPTGAKASPEEKRNRAIASISGDQGLADKLAPVSGLSVAPMAKCGRCFESFFVADMVTEPKSGKLYCAGCVENMRNSQ